MWKWVGKNAVFCWIGAGLGAVYESPLFDDWRWWAFSVPATVLTTIAIAINRHESYCEAIADAVAAVQEYYKEKEVKPSS